MPFPALTAVRVAVVLMQVKVLLALAVMVGIPALFITTTVVDLQPFTGLVTVKV